MGGSWKGLVAACVALALAGGAEAAATFASAELGECHLLLLLYICRKWRGEPRPLDASALKWVRPNQMFALDMPPADTPLIGLLDALI